MKCQKCNHTNSQMSVKPILIGISYVFLLVLIVFLMFRVVVLVSQRDEAHDDVLLALQFHQSTSITLAEQLAEANAILDAVKYERDWYRGVIEQNLDIFYHHGRNTGLPSLTDDGEECGVSPGIDSRQCLPLRTPPPPPPSMRIIPLIPENPGFRYHFIEPGQNLAYIAQIYWLHNLETPTGRDISNRLVQHLMETNSIRDPENLFAGTYLRIYLHPYLQQVFY